VRQSATTISSPGLVGAVLNPHRMGVRIFVDETKAKGYLVVAVLCPDESVALARRTIGRLVLPGQRSVHMKHERDRRRRQIANAVVGLRACGIRAVVLDAGRGPEPEYVRRERALRVLVEIAAGVGSASLVLDLDRTLVARDSRTIAAASRELAIDVAYRHASLASERLLAIPDVIAWSWARGGDWRRRITPIVVESRSV
jgi:hypothetical protein